MRMRIQLKIQAVLLMGLRGSSDYPPPNRMLDDTSKRAGMCSSKLYCNYRNLHPCHTHQPLQHPRHARAFLNGLRRCCKTLATKDSHCEFMRLDGAHEQAITRPLPHDELVQLHGVSAQARVAADLAGQGHDLACAA